MGILYFNFQQMMYFTIPLLVVALAGMFSERSGIVNIALDGKMVIGGFSGAIFIYLFKNDLSVMQLLFFGLIIAAISGGLISLVHAYASITMKADQTISGTAINMFSTAFAIFMARMIKTTQQVEFNTNFLIQEVPVLSKIPVIGDLFFKNAFITTYIGFIILVISAFVLYKTRFGLRLRSCGEFPQAADSVGINVSKIRYIAVIISGILAGVGGFIFVITTSNSFNGDVGGYGFLAVAVLIFGQWNPSKILFASVFFGLMKTLSNTYSTIPFLVSLNLPTTVYKIIPFVATLVLLAMISKKSAAPKALGEIFDKGKR